MLLFVQLHLFSAIVIGVKFGMEQIYGVVIGGIAAIMLVFMAILLWKRPKHFGDYKIFFKSSNFNSNFYMIVIVFRLIIGISIPAFSDSIIGISIAIGVIVL
jgi:nitrate reductase gamma subunit